MYSISSQAVFWVSFSILSSAGAQITISSISGCANNTLGTATYSTQVTLPTTTNLKKSDKKLKKKKTSWTFSTDSKRITFSNLGIPGWGAGSGIPQVDHDALKIDGSKTKWTLLLPTMPPSSGKYDIVFDAATSSPAPFPTAAGVRTGITLRDSASIISGSRGFEQGASGYGRATATSGIAALAKRQKLEHASATRGLPAAVTRNAINELKVQKHAHVGAKFRRASSPMNFQLTIVGVVGCLSNQTGTPPKPTSSVTSNVAVASMCSNNEISAVTQSWTTYGVSILKTLHCS